MAEEHHTVDEHGVGTRWPTPEESGTARVARAALLVMAAFVVSRVLGLVRDILIARQFATSPELAAYVAAFRIPDLLFVLVAGGALASAFIPTLAAYHARGDVEGGWKLTAAVGTWLLILTGTAAVVVAIIAPWIVRYVLAPGFPPPLHALTARLMRIMLAATVVFSLSGLLMGVLHAHQHFLLPAIAPALYNIGIIFGAVALAPRIGVYGLAVGVVLGAVAHLTVQLPGLIRLHPRLRPNLGLDDPRVAVGVREVVRLMLPRMAGLAVVQLNFVVITILASFLNPQALPSLDYAWRIMLLPQGVFALAVATAAFPTFAAQAARSELAAMRETFCRILSAVLFLTLPAAVGLALLREPIVALLLQRGAFGTASTAAVAWALLFYAPGLVGHSVVEITTRAFYALHDTVTPVLVGGGAMLVNILLSLLLLPRFGDPGNLARGPHGGLALANTLATTLEMVALLWLLRQRLHGLADPRLLRGIGRSLAASAFMGVALVAISRWTEFSTWSPHVRGAVGILAGAWVYMGAAWLMRAEEVQAMPRLLLERFGR